MLKTLVKIRLKGLFASFLNRKKTKASSKVLIGVLGIYLLACFAFLFGSIFFTLCEPLSSMGLDWLFFSLMGAIVFLLCFIGSVFATQSQLYMATDNDLLLSMPVPPSYILGSRMMALMGLNYIYEVLIILPGIVVYCIDGKPSVIGLIFFVVAFLFLPFLAMSFSAIFGWLIALVSSKMRNKDTVIMILTLAFFLAYMYACFTMQNSLTTILKNGQSIAHAMETVLWPLYQMGVGIAQGDAVSLLLFIASCVAPFLIIYWVLSKTFRKVAIANKGRKKIEYVEKPMKENSLSKSLIIKESRSFFRNPMYMFNSGIGLLFMLIGGVAAIFEGSKISQAVTMLGLNGHEDILMCLFLALTTSMTIITSPMISLEAKTFWILKSAPISDRDVLKGKAFCHILISAPFIVVTSVLLTFGFKLPVYTCLIGIVFGMLVTALNAFCGLMLNLKYPKFDWINETAAIKQGAAPMLSMFAMMATGILYILLLVLWYKLNWDLDLYLVVIIMATAVAARVLYALLMKSGVNMFRKLQI